VSASVDGEGDGDGGTNEGGDEIEVGAELAGEVGDLAALGELVAAAGGAGDDWGYRGRARGSRVQEGGVGLERAGNGWAGNGGAGNGWAGNGWAGKGGAGNGWAGNGGTGSCLGGRQFFEEAAAGGSDVAEAGRVVAEGLADDSGLFQEVAVEVDGGDEVTGVVEDGGEVVGSWIPGSGTTGKQIFGERAG
jgi:hypothetical protein